MHQARPCAPIATKWHCHVVSLGAIAVAQVGGRQTHSNNAVPSLPLVIRTRAFLSGIVVCAPGYVANPWVFDSDTNNVWV